MAGILVRRLVRQRQRVCRLLRRWLLLVQPQTSQRSNCSHCVRELTLREVTQKEKAVLGTVLIVILILALLGALPRWSHSRNWGYAPSGGVSLAILVVVILLLLGRI